MKQKIKNRIINHLSGRTIKISNFLSSVDILSIKEEVHGEFTILMDLRAGMLLTDIRLRSIDYYFENYYSLYFHRLKYIKLPCIEIVFR